MLSIDWDESFKLANNDAELAKELIADFVVQLLNEAPHIFQAYQAKNYSLLYDHVHHVYGSCCYTGVGKLGAKLIEIQDELKSAKLDPMKLRRLMHELEQEINFIEQDAKELGVND